MDGAASKPVEGVDNMARFLRVVKEANINQKEAVGDFSADPKRQAKMYVQFHNGEFNPSTLPKFMAITPNLQLAVQPPTNTNGSHETILANLSAANKKLPKELQLSWDELKGLGGVSDTIALTGEPNPDKYNPATDPTNTNPVKEGESNQPAVGDTTWAKVVANTSGSYDVIDFEGNKINTNLSLADATAQAKVSDEEYKKVAPELSSSIKVQPESVAEDTGMSRFISIISESKSPLNRLTAAESMAMNHYTHEAARTTITSPVLNVAKDSKPSMIGKYFATVEQELKEAAERPNERATRLARRVIERIVPNADGSLPDPSINRLTGKPNPPAAEPAATPTNVKPGGATVEYGGATYSVNVFGDGIRPRLGPGNKAVGAKAYIVGDKIFVLLDPTAQEDVNSRGIDEEYDGEPDEYHVLRHQTKDDIDKEITMPAAWTRVKEFDSYQAARRLYNELKEKNPSQKYTITTHSKSKREAYRKQHSVQEGLKDPKDNPCWKGYKPVGTKKKGGRTVPNCVPKK